MNPSICVLTGIYAPDTGGPAKFAQTFSEYRSFKNGITNVITYTNEKSYQIEKSHGTVYATNRSIPVFLRYLRTILLINKQINSNSKILANGCFVELAILRFFRKFQYSVKIPGDIVWERARNKSATLQDVISFQNCKLPCRYKVLRFLFSYSLKSASVVIVPSSQLRDFAITWGVESSKVELIHNSVAVPKSMVELSQVKYDFVTLSRLVPWKGIDQVIKSVCGQGLKLLIIGDGPERKNLEWLSLKYPGLVEFAGEVASDEVENWLKKSKAFILNSSFEATSYALLEAMSLGLVPIANSGTGSQEIINHGVNGILCGSDTNMDLSSAISFIARHSKESQKMGAEARRSVKEKFNLEKNYFRIMQRCIDV